ncbi:MAG: T9SS type A sorting domain-containing protein [FCB group bacterium]|nr:T9SS type A sorting domain-containing protein [FCB group bacterium]
MKYSLAVLAVLVALNSHAMPQTYVFFDESPTDASYDPSWGYVNAPSELERVGEKFPVSTEHVFQGVNSLKLHWTSNAGGDWGIAVAEIGWPGHDVTLVDTLSFWAYSDTLIPAEDLPLIYLEDLGNNKTARFSLADYSADIPDSQWVAVKVPLNIFHGAAQNADLTAIKTIFYGQDIADGEEHTLYLDEIRMYRGNTNDTIPPAIPTGLVATPYERHIELQWTPNTEADIRGYNIYHSPDGNNYQLVGYTTNAMPIFNHFVGGSGITAHFKISAVDSSYNESGFSTEVSAVTRAMSDEELLTMVQEATFRYFWDYAHPVSHLARERTNGNENIVTIGGSGFGVMAILVGIERGFITRAEGAERILQILNFLNSADRFHGAWPHWMNGETGAVIPFSQYDDGGDLVETAFMIQGLLTARQYFDQDNATENQIDSLITYLWETVEWDWYRRSPSGNYLYWHWSPNYGWTMNFALIGPNETMITYLLAIASPTHPIPASLYEDGWAGSPNYDNGNTFYGYTLDVGWDYGGPLFFAHYSFLGFDPRNKRDRHTNYFINNRNQTLINRAYCIDNPGGYVGYGENCWGLTASDDPLVGYMAHEPIPGRDNGTIAPTAALSSFPYTPEQSMNALKHFYRDLGEKIWGPFGFRDAFNQTYDWYADSYLAIDQGPIIVMIENYRTGLLWENFMANPEIQPMLDAIGFVPDSTTTSVANEATPLPHEFTLLGNYPNPFNPATTIRFYLPGNTPVKITVYDIRGGKVMTLADRYFQAGYNEVRWKGVDDRLSPVGSGIYFYKVETPRKILTGKMILVK